MSLTLDGRHALVTGAGRGIGAEVARALGAAGANVTLLGRSRAALEETAATCNAAPICCTTADVSSASAVAKAFAAARAAFGPIQILVNNAGQAVGAALHKTTDEQWTNMLAVNLSGTFHCMREALPDMLKGGYGRIVSIASTAGLAGYRYAGAYCAAKHGVIGLTRSVALEVAMRNVNVNAVCPGYTQTDLLEGAVATISAVTGRSPEAARAELVAESPQRRFVTAAEVTNAVLWLCSPGSEAITGQAIAVAGGAVMS